MTTSLLATVLVVSLIAKKGIGMSKRQRISVIVLLALAGLAALAGAVSILPTWEPISAFLTIVAAIVSAW